MWQAALYSSCSGNFLRGFGNTCSGQYGSDALEKSDTEMEDYMWIDLTCATHSVYKTSNKLLGQYAWPLASMHICLCDQLQLLNV